MNPPDGQRPKRRRTDEADPPASSSNQAVSFPTLTKLTSFPTPRALVIVTPDVRRLRDSDRDCIYDELYKNLLGIMLGSRTTLTPHFESVSKTNPFGLTFKPVNSDAEKFLRAAVAVNCHLLPNSTTVVRLEEEVNVKMKVEVPSHPDNNETEATAFGILKATNQRVIDTSRWIFGDNLESKDTGNIAFHFGVPFAHAPALMSRQLYFLFGVVQVECYDEPKTLSRPILSVSSVSSQESPDHVQE